MKVGIHATLSAIALERPEWITEADVRAAGIQDLWNVSRYAELSLIFIRNHLSDVDWWLELRGDELAPRQMIMEHAAFADISRFAAFQMAASALENVMRHVLRAIAPGAANDGRAEFKSIYECLLKTQLGFPAEDLALMELIRLTRNTMHNVGVQRTPKGTTQSIPFRERTYEFIHGNPIEFATWDFVLHRVDDMRELLERVNSAPIVSSHPAIIKADWVTFLGDVA